ncbi:hypothetical protein SUGI_1120740 [Cryptomeria japonica]|nr:hypothetical protein SUGI_1120740 [Cryptomeria japonica]
MHQNLFNHLICLNRNGEFLNNDLIRLGDINNHPSDRFPVGQICGLASAQAVGFSGRIDRDKSDLSSSDMLLNLRVEEEVATTIGLHHII